MKQRTHLMQGGDDMMGFSTGKCKKMDGDETNEIRLHKIKPPDHFIEAQILEGDTLQAIALRFHCSLSELKRINHIDKDNEIFARRTIKIPVTPYSVLTEMIPLPTEPTPSTSNHAYTNPLVHGLVNDGHTDSQNRNTKESREDDFAIDCNSIVLNSTLTPSVIPYTDGQTLEEASEDSQLLPSKPKDPVEALVVKELTSHGADFGLKWFHLVMFMLILGVVAPLVYITLVLDKSKDANETHSDEAHVDRAPLSLHS